MAQFKTILKARYLRREETKAEAILWKVLRNNHQDVKWRRQHPVDMYILDFYAPSIKLAIELDGSVHKESREYDKDRTDYLGAKCIKVLRFWNSEVEKNLEVTLNQIEEVVKNFLCI